MAGAANAPADEVTISLGQMAYTPGDVTIKVDTDVTLRLVNNGLAMHNLTIDAPGVRGEMLAAGEEMKLTVNLPAGDYGIGCDVPGHRRHDRCDLRRGVTAPHKVKREAPGDESIAGRFLGCACAQQRCSVSHVIGG